MFDILNSFDWMTPAQAMAETLLRGPFAGHVFYVGLGSGPLCERILEEQGISIYARCTAKGDAFFTVEKSEAEEAERLLLLAGIPLKYHLFSERNCRYLR